ncbi:MAG: sensor histidine kinase [Bacteroidia bacterium]|nr:sensor histidine kinase [Bacteroidia bacterium]
MRKYAPLLLQAVAWTGLWMIFTFSGHTADKLPGHYIVSALRVVNMALLFNVSNYLLLPMYFSGKRRAFFWLAPLVFVGYIGLSVTLELTLGRPENTMRLTEAQRANPWKIPLRFIIIPPFFTGLSIFGIAATYRGFSAFENQKKAEEEANRRRLEAEIALLKSQINPHFLLNTLNNLYTLALTDPAKTPDALLKLSEMVAYILYECASPRVPLAHDLAFIGHYIALQHLRLPPNVVLTTDLPEDLPEGLEIEPMILITFIENAFKHGLTTRQASEIHISIQVRGRHLRLLVSNPLLPPKPNVHGQPHGIGMANTRQRLAHTYPGLHTLDVTQDDHDHRVTLDLTL